MTARKTKLDPFLTSKENIALDLAFEWLGESRVNRTMEEYREIASRIPNLTERPRPQAAHPRSPGWIALGESACATHMWR